MKDHKIAIKSEAQLEANYRFTILDESIIAKLLLKDWGLSESLENMRKLVEAIRKPSETFAAHILAVVGSYRGPELRVVECHNKIPNVLRYEMAKLIAGQTVTPTFKANYLALWNGTNAPADTDTTLQTELVRGTFQQRSAIDNVSYLDKFWASSEVGGLTILEAWTFVDGTGTANSGFLLSRAVINVVVGSTETLTCNVSISLTSAT